MTKNLMDDRHYAKLPICGFCMNAWDVVLGRPPWDTRCGSLVPGQWVRLCPVGGCDPDIWEYLDDSGEYNGKKVKTNDGTYHRRSDEGSALWRKRWSPVVTRFCSRGRENYEAVRDKNGFVVSKALIDDEIDWGDEDEDEESDQTSETSEPIWD